MASITFAGLSLDVAPYHVDTLEGLVGSPDVRRYEQPRAARGGVMTSPPLYSGRTVTIGVNVNHTTQASFVTALDDLVDALAEAFAAADDSELGYDLGGPQTALFCRPVRWQATTDTVYHHGLSRVVFELFAADPLRYSDPETATTVPIAASGGGFVFPLVFPLVFAGGGSSGTATIVNAGNAAAPLRFRINGPVTGPTIHSDATDSDLTLDLTVGSGEWVDIDTKERSVLLNGTASRYNTLTAVEWFDLIPGSNTIRFSGASGGAPTLDVYSRSAWL